MKLSSAPRPKLRYAGREASHGINLEETKRKPPTVTHSNEKGEPIADLTEHGQQFNPLQRRPRRTGQS